MVDLVTSEQIEKAYHVLEPVVTKTLLQYDDYLSKKYQATVYLKREDLQIVRSFKLRGAYYAISQLPEEKLKKGVVCASAGNHAQGVAYTCFKMGVSATIFMPVTTPKQKVNQVEAFGGDQVTIKLAGDTFDQSKDMAIFYGEEHGLTFINPFDDENIIAGQGTVALEIVEQLNKKQASPADYVFTPIGGGGLISGVSAYFKDKSPTTKIIGVEPIGAASMLLSLKEQHVTPLSHLDKFVDGAAVQEVGEMTFLHSQQLVDAVCDVPVGKVCSTILELYTKQAIVVEPAGALSVTALDDYKEEIKGKTVVCIISGGNNDIQRMPEIEERSLIYEGLKHYFVVNFPQRAGALKEFVSDVLGPHDDITKFEYTKKLNRGSGPVVIGILLQDHNDYASLIERLTIFDPNYINLQENESLYTLLV
ncbi:threonine ammonia-lyase IlvA [Vagococcus bubulae]|nr:threonine ammonia-lyase IlvA [Vagococcus bubulae]